MEIGLRALTLVKPLQAAELLQKNAEYGELAAELAAVQAAHRHATAQATQAQEAAVSDAQSKAAELKALAAELSALKLDNKAALEREAEAVTLAEAHNALVQKHSRQLAEFEAEADGRAASHKRELASMAAGAAALQAEARKRDSELEHLRGSHAAVSEQLAARSVGQAAEAAALAVQLESALRRADEHRDLLAARDERLAELQGRAEASETRLRDKDAEVERLKPREAELGNELARSSAALQAAETRLAEAVEAHRLHACSFHLDPLCLC